MLMIERFAVLTTILILDVKREEGEEEVMVWRWWISVSPFLEVEEAVGGRLVIVDSKVRGVKTRRKGRGSSCSIGAILGKSSSFTTSTLSLNFCFLGRENGRKRCIFPQTLLLFSFAKLGGGFTTLSSIEIIASALTGAFALPFSRLTRSFSVAASAISASSCAISAIILSRFRRLEALGERGIIRCAGSRSSRLRFRDGGWTAGACGALDFWVWELDGGCDAASGLVGLGSLGFKGEEMRLRF